MYLLGTHIPIYVHGDRTYVEDSWFADIDLARQYFAPHFGKLKVIGPSLPYPTSNSKSLQEVSANFDDLSLHPSIDARTRVRTFWPKAYRQWKRDLAPLITEATVVHASVDDPFQPMQLETIRAGIKEGKTTVLIGFDMDLWELLGIQLKKMNPYDAALHIFRTLGMDYWMRYCVKRASVSMLKEGLVFERYSGGAKNPKAFCHSMHSEKHIISENALDKRLAAVQSGRPLRLVYFGRLTKRKGITDAIRIVSGARKLGVNASFDLIGEGEQQAELAQLVQEIDATESIGFLGSFPYGDGLHLKLRKYDALLFTPTEEDTPRMVYDAYASGLPLLTTDIAFLRHRKMQDNASILFGIGNTGEGVSKLCELDSNRDLLVTLSKNARQAGVRHSVEQWYGKRLEWTLEAVESSSRN
ncbi:MAG: glycosyltransferase [Gammaproteobacteria bacterium]|nr:glycosyltransferase [Gammaproteobacteria bacterium]